MRYLLPSIHPLLTKGIANAYKSGLEKQNKLPGVRTLTTEQKQNTRPVSFNRISKKPDAKSGLF